jgi:hypothetical protein
VKEKDHSISCDTDDQELGEVRGEPRPLDGPLDIPATIARASGLYQMFELLPDRRPPTQPPRPRPAGTMREELRLDVDGRYPLMVASGTRYVALGSVVHWIADVRPVLSSRSRPTWEGDIWYKHGHAAGLPQTRVRIAVSRSFARGQVATVTFSGAGAPRHSVTCDLKSPFFRYIDPVTALLGQVEVEFDSAEGEAPTTSVDTCGHPNRPATLGCENLSLDEVFRRVGFNAVVSPGVSTVPLAGAGANALWSDIEMHDAMQVYWSDYATWQQWGIWVLFASGHEQGAGLGGIMFDGTNAPTRQGCAVFNDSFIATPDDPNDPDPAAWVRRNLFLTTCHEMGHCFNLAHSWQKRFPLGRPWHNVRLVDEPEARSYMNYPRRVRGGSRAFFSDFEYRFSDQELLYMRHAPESFVEPGWATWFDDHGFQGAAVSPTSPFELELRVNRANPSFEFLEPVTIEAKLTNVSSDPVLVEDHALSADELLVIIKKSDKPARQLVPFARYFRRSEKRVLNPGESLYESVFVSAGRNGWDLAEPGNYTVQAALQMPDEDLVSNPLKLRVGPPASYEEQLLAQDVFTDEVGRILAFGGSRYLEKGNEVLRAVAEKLPHRRLALHARRALGNALMRDHKLLVRDQKQPIKHERAQPREARQLLNAALLEQMEAALETFGHIGFKRHVARYSDWLAEQGHAKEAASVRTALSAILEKKK